MARGDDISPNTILDAQTGDYAALDAVLQAYQARLHKMAHKLTHSRDESMNGPLVNAGRMGLIEAVRKYQERQQAAFWTFAYYKVRGQMLDELAEQLGLSDDARKAYPKVQKAYLLLQEKLGRVPRSAEIVAESGVTKGLVEQIVRVLFQPAASLDELAEREWEWRPAQQTLEPEHTLPPDVVVINLDDLVRHQENVQIFCLACLGPVETARYLALTILREDFGGYHYSWDEIAAILQGSSEPPDAEWGTTIRAEFIGWTCLPPTWAEVQELFLRRNPHPTGEYLRQRFSQARRLLVQSLPQGAPPAVVLEQPYG